MRHAVLVLFYFMGNFELEKKNFERILADLERIKKINQKSTSWKIRIFYLQFLYKIFHLFHLFHLFVSSFHHHFVSHVKIVQKSSKIIKIRREDTRGLFQGHQCNKWMKEKYFKHKKFANINFATKFFLFAGRWDQNGIQIPIPLRSKWDPNPDQNGIHIPIPLRSRSRSRWDPDRVYGCNRMDADRDQSKKFIKIILRNKIYT